MIGIVRRHPGRGAAIAGVVVTALVVAVAVRLGGDGTVAAGRLEPRSELSAPTAIDPMAGRERGAARPSGGVEPSTDGGVEGGERPATVPRPTAPPPSGGGGGQGGEPVAPRAPVRCPAEGSPTGAPLPAADERDGLRWVTAGRLTGRCDGSSAPFPLLGIDTRLAWRSDADSFAVFVVDVVQGRDASAGFADGQCPAPCSESQPIVPAAGRYTLEVQAGDGSWEVEVQEYRRP